MSAIKPHNFSNKNPEIEVFQKYSFMFVQTINHTNEKINSIRDLFINFTQEIEIAINLDLNLNAEVNSKEKRVNGIKPLKKNYLEILNTNKSIFQCFEKLENLLFKENPLKKEKVELPSKIIQSVISLILKFFHIYDHGFLSNVIEKKENVYNKENELSNYIELFTSVSLNENKNKETNKPSFNFRLKVDIKPTLEKIANIIINEPQIRNSPGFIKPFTSEGGNKTKIPYFFSIISLLLKYVYLEQEIDVSNLILKILNLMNTDELGIEYNSESFNEENLLYLEIIFLNSPKIISVLSNFLLQLEFKSILLSKKLMNLLNFLMRVYLLRLKHGEVKGKGVNLTTTEVNYSKFIDFSTCIFEFYYYSFYYTSKIKEEKYNQLSLSITEFLISTTLFISEWAGRKIENENDRKSNSKELEEYNLKLDLKINNVFSYFKLEIEVEEIIINKSSNKLDSREIVLEINKCKEKYEEELDELLNKKSNSNNYFILMLLFSELFDYFSSSSENNNFNEINQRIISSISKLILSATTFDLIFNIKKSYCILLYSLITHNSTKLAKQVKLIFLYFSVKKNLQKFCGKSLENQEKFKSIFNDLNFLFLSLVSKTIFFGSFFSNFSNKIFLFELINLKNELFFIENSFTTKNLSNFKASLKTKIKKQFLIEKNEYTFGLKGKNRPPNPNCSRKEIKDTTFSSTSEDFLIIKKERDYGMATPPKNQIEEYGNSFFFYYYDVLVEIERITGFFFSNKSHKDPDYSWVMEIDEILIELLMENVGLMQNSFINLETLNLNKENEEEREEVEEDYEFLPDIKLNLLREGFSRFLGLGILLLSSRKEKYNDTCLEKIRKLLEIIEFYNYILQLTERFIFSSSNLILTYSDSELKQEKVVDNELDGKNFETKTDKEREKLINNIFTDSFTSFSKLPDFILVLKLIKLLLINEVFEIAVNSQEEEEVEEGINSLLTKTDIYNFFEFGLIMFSKKELLLKHTSLLLLTNISLFSTKEFSHITVIDSLLIDAIEKEILSSFFTINSKIISSFTNYSNKNYINLEITSTEKASFNDSLALIETLFEFSVFSSKIKKKLSNVFLVNIEFLFGIFDSTLKKRDFKFLKLLCLFFEKNSEFYSLLNSIIVKEQKSNKAKKGLYLNFEFDLIKLVDLVFQSSTKFDEIEEINQA